MYEVKLDADLLTRCYFGPTLAPPWLQTKPQTAASPPQRGPGAHVLHKSVWTCCRASGWNWELLIKLKRGFKEHTEGGCQPLGWVGGVDRLKVESHVLVLFTVSFFASPLFPFLCLPSSWLFLSFQLLLICFYPSFLHVHMVWQKP